MKRPKPGRLGVAKALVLGTYVAAAYGSFKAMRYQTIEKVRYACLFWAQTGMLRSLVQLETRMEPLESLFCAALYTVCFTSQWRESRIEKVLLWCSEASFLPVECVHRKGHTFIQKHLMWLTLRLLCTCSLSLPADDLSRLGEVAHSALLAVDAALQAKRSETHRDASTQTSQPPTKQNCQAPANQLARHSSAKSLPPLHQKPMRAQVCNKTTASKQQHRRPVSKLSRQLSVQSMR